MKCRGCSKEAEFRYIHRINGEIKKEFWICWRCLEKMKKELKRFDEVKFTHIITK